MPLAEQLFSYHGRVDRACRHLGLQSLPEAVHALYDHKFYNCCMPLRKLDGTIQNLFYLRYLKPFLGIFSGHCGPLSWGPIILNARTCIKVIAMHASTQRKPTRGWRMPVSPAHYLATTGTLFVGGKYEDHPARSWRRISGALQHEGAHRSIHCTGHSLWRSKMKRQFSSCFLEQRRQCAGETRLLTQALPTAVHSTLRRMTPMRWQGCSIVRLHSYR
jgi:hypothetical protein